MKKQSWSRFGVAVACALVLVATGFGQVEAAVPPPGPANGSSGLQGKVETPAPTTAATIGTPSNGQSFSKMPITVNGLCTNGLLIKIFANNIFVGSAMCNNGSYTLQVDLFDGRNDLVARQFDALDQPGPDSNIVTVTYNNAAFAATTVPLLSLTSIYARKGANPGATLEWPITISGGSAPYAISVDWGDGKGSDLYSQQFAGSFNIHHVYQNAGVYVVTVKATDKNGLTAFLQLVGQANGAVTQSTSQASTSSPNAATIITKVLWVPAAFCIPLILLSFWLGRRYELSALRRHLEHPED
ncbi:MAG TPA: PKD domain-containing protein [Patescibacteria group bacterium]|nr:PKD domain-containing protein [Patescibacteria group bacterium]